jgi:single-stranded-DNA-specific exonuclease
MRVEKRWRTTEHDYARAKAFADEIGESPLVAALMISRGHDDAESAERFLNPRLEHLHDPYLLEDMDKAVDRILKAIDSREKILVWGDYDVDGTTGTVVLRKAIDILGGISSYHIPHRFREGYGLNIEYLQKAKEDGCSLVISVDTGSRAFEAADWARENGLELIISDHHLSDSERGNPDAYAVVNPNRHDCNYPDKHLAGVGVAFKIAHALLRARGKENLIPAFLKMVAIGTIADIMQLTGENRSIVALGLKDLPSARNHGLKALIDVADCGSEMSSLDIGFRIAPRINAAGRMDEGRAVIQLFEAPTFEEARKIAQKLDELNRRRQDVQADIFKLALDAHAESASSIDTSHVAVVYGYGWHRGVIGLASSKITDRLYRPSLVISIEDGVGHGSGRSIEGFNLHDALESCKEVFEKFGGHAAACGFTIKEENISELSTRLNSYAKDTLTEEDLRPLLRIDAELKSSSISLGLVDALKRMEPFGAGNPKPRFSASKLSLTADPLIMKERHLKLRLQDSEGKPFEAVWWDGVEKGNHLDLAKEKVVSVAFTPEANHWNGQTRLQLVVDDIRLDNS